MRVLWRVTGLAPRVCCTPAELLERMASGVNVLVYEPGHAAALNLNRGLVRERASPYVVWAPGSLDEHLRREAPDFFDGLNSVVRGVECFTRESVHRVLHAGLRGVLRWTGPGALGSVLDAARGPASWTSVDGRVGYPELRAAAADPRWVVVEGVSTSHDATRLRLALAETQRVGRCVLVRSEVAWPGVEDFGDETSPVALAASRLTLHCDAPALLVALLECDPHLVERAAEAGHWGPDRMAALARGRRPHATLLRRASSPGTRPKGGSFAHAVATLVHRVAGGSVPDLDSVQSAQALGLLDVAQDWLSRQPGTDDAAEHARRLALLGQNSLAAGRYAEAEGTLRARLGIVERLFGREHPEFGVSLHELAVVLERRGRYEEAEGLLRESLGIFERTVGREHSRYGAALHALAAILRVQGRYVQAEALLRGSLGIFERTVGREHPNFAAALHQLAVAVENQGRHQEAERLLNESLEIAERTLGREHSSYGVSLHALAGVLRSLGRSEEAEGLLRESLSIFERTVGREHPSYGASLFELAGMLGDLGRFEEAEAFLRESLGVDGPALGRGHPDYGATLHELARALRDQGRFEEAEASLKESLAIVESTLGRKHPSYAASLLALAGVISNLGRRAEALVFAREALAVFENALGPEHPNVAISCVNLARMLALHGEVAEAKSQAERGVQILRGALGGTHPTTLQAESVLASLTPRQPSEPSV